jgi:hypothetical protein
MSESTQTPTRKRPTRKSMTESSLEESREEVEDLLKLPLSPTTIQTLRDLQVDFNELQKLDRKHPSYERKFRELMRAEIYTKRILNKDAKYAILAAQHKELAEQKMLIELGDYHRGNLNHLKIVAREMIKEKFSREKKDAPDAEARRKVTKDRNPLEEGKTWSELLEILDQESHALKEWRCAAQEAQRVKIAHTTPKPDRSLTNFIALAGQRCARKMELEQIRFEMEQYVSRNELAHIGLDDIISAAKTENNANSEHWKTLAQVILAQKNMINDGIIPRSLKGYEALIKESLLVYQEIHFETLLPDDANFTGVWEPAELVVSERNQPTPPEIFEEDVTPQVESFEPADTWETAKRDEYLLANAQVNKIKAEIGGFEKEISDAGEMKKYARKRLNKAYRQLNAARVSFKSMQADIIKDLGEEFDQDEEMN